MLFQAVANALEAAIEAANADKRQAAALWKEVQKAPESLDDLLAGLNDRGFEFTARPQKNFPLRPVPHSRRRGQDQGRGLAPSCSGKRRITSPGD